MTLRIMSSAFSFHMEHHLWLWLAKSYFPQPFSLNYFVVLFHLLMVATITSPSLLPLPPSLCHAGLLFHLYRGSIALLRDSTLTTPHNICHYGYSYWNIIPTARTLYLAFPCRAPLQYSHLFIIKCLCDSMKISAVLVWSSWWYFIHRFPYNLKTSTLNITFWSWKFWHGTTIIKNMTHSYFICRNDWILSNPSIL